MDQYEKRARNKEARVLHNKQVAKDNKKKPLPFYKKHIEEDLRAFKVLLERIDAYKIRTQEKRSSIYSYTGNGLFRSEWHYFDYQLTFLDNLLQGAADLLRYMIDKLNRMKSNIEQLEKEEEQ